jgi:hypothetical protein
LPRVEIELWQLPSVFQHKRLGLELSIDVSLGRRLVSDTQFVVIMWTGDLNARRQLKLRSHAKRLFIPVSNISDKQALVVKGLKARQTNSSYAVKPKPA